MTQIQRLIIRCFETFLLPLTTRNKSAQMSHFPLNIYYERYEIKKCSSEPQLHIDYSALCCCRVNTELLFTEFLVLTTKAENAQRRYTYLPSWEHDGPVGIFPLLAHTPLIPNTEIINRTQTVCFLLLIFKIEDPSFYLKNQRHKMQYCSFH